jgi:prolyl oligopeptidase
MDVLQGRPTRLLPYPQAPRSARVEVRHGTAVPDPYDWLGGDEVGPVREWMAAQQALTDAYFDANPEQARIKAWLEDFLDRPYVFHAVDSAARRFMLEERPGVSQPVLIARDHAGGAERLVVGPNDLARAGATVLCQAMIYPSPCGRYIAYFVKAAGEHAERLQLKDVETGAALEAGFPETILGAVSWLPDSSGFYYNQNQDVFVEEARRCGRPDGLWRHALGRPVADDEFVHPMDFAQAHAAIPTVSADGRFLFVNQIRLVADVSTLATIPLAADGAPAGPTTALEEPAIAAFGYIGERDGLYLFETDLGAKSNGRIIGFKFNTAGLPSLVEVVAESEMPIALTLRKPRAERATVVGDRIYVAHLHGPVHQVAEYDFEGRRLRILDLPEACSVAGQGGDRYGDLSASADGRSLLIDLWTFTQAPCAHVYDLATDALSMAAPDRAPPSLPDVEVQRIFYPSFDGVKIPASIISQRGTLDRGPAPLLLYGYGAAGMSITPEFDLDIVGWLALGGVYVVANIRGGGEYGEAWHQAASGLRRETSFDDFCAAAEHLVGAGLTTVDRLAIRGISAGGLLVGACMMRRPELFGAVLAVAPLLDALGVGRDTWSIQLAPEFGNPTADPAAFEAIAKYSPLYKLDAARRHPPNLIVLAADDAQLLTDGGRKFTAGLQAGSDSAPHLLHVIRNAGHTGWDKHQLIDSASHELAFLFTVLEGDLALPELLHDRRHC